MQKKLDAGISMEEMLKKLIEKHFGRNNHYSLSEDIIFKMDGFRWMEDC